MQKNTKDGICAMLDATDKAYQSNENMLHFDEVIKMLGLSSQTKRSYLARLQQLNINPVPLPNNSPFNTLPNLWERVKDQFLSTAADELPVVSRRVYADLYHITSSPYGMDMPERYKETKKNINELAKLVQLKPNMIYWLPAPDTDIHKYKWYEDQDMYLWRSEHRSDLLVDYIQE